MKQFLKHSILFIIPILVAMVFLDFYISNKLQKTHADPGEIEVWNDIYSGAIDADIAIYGSSRAWVLFDPNIMEQILQEKVYNLGIDGHNFETQYLRHLEYIKYNPSPKRIIVSVDAFSLKAKEELYNYPQFLPFMLWNKNIYTYTSKLEGFTTLDYYIPLIRYAGNMQKTKHIISNYTDTEALRKKGYKGVERSWTNNLAKAKAKMDRYDVVLDSTIVNLMHHFIKETIKKNIEVYLVYAPEYVEGQEFISNRDEILAIYKEMSKEYNIPFLDYSQGQINTQKEYFYNALHLNKKGAEKFTLQLAVDFAQRFSTTE